MAVTYGFFNSVNGDRKYNAEQMSEYFRGIVNEGVFQHLDGGLAVTAGTGLAVSVASGRAIIQNRWVQNSDAMTLSISAASETYARKDAVVVRLNYSTRSIEIAVKAGTPAASPVAPSMTRNSTTYEMALAYVNVAANATSVTITDKRSDSTVCGWATVAQSTSGEVDAQLNAMKTGFDGVEYDSPVEMVQGEDQKLQDRIDEIINVDLTKFTTWEQGTAYNIGSVLKIEGASTRCRVLSKAIDRSIKRIVAKAGYQFVTYWCTYDGTTYTVVGKDATWNTSFDVSQYSDTYYIVIAAGKTDTSAAITPQEATDNILFYNELSLNVDFVRENREDIDLTTRSVLLSPIDADDVQYGKLFYSYNNSVLSIADGILKRVNVESGVDYYVTTSLMAASAGFPLIIYFDSNDQRIGFEYMNTENVTISISKQKLNLPSGTSWFYVNARYTDSVIYIKDEPSATLPEIIEKVNQLPKNQISILFVGNSLTQDGIAYLPYLLKTYYPEISFKFYMWYNGGYDLGQQYEKFVNDQVCEIFSVAEGIPTWTNTTKKMSEILSIYTFDIVCLQEYFNYKESYTDSDLDDWNNCRDYIIDNYTGGNGLEFISLFHAPKRDAADSIFAKTVAGNNLILQKTIADDMIPNGIAVYRALSTELDNLGDQGHLSPDGTHTQEGLPCLLQTYVAACWLFDRLGLPRSVYGCPLRMTTAIYNTLNVPGPNLGTGVITGTDAENILAQEVAIKAYKEGKYYVNNNIFVPATS